MTVTVKLAPNDKRDWLKTHTLTPEQRKQLITQKLEHAVKQFEANAKAQAVA